MDNDKLTPDLLLATFLTDAFKELIKEAVHDGFHKEYECGLNDLWAAIPTKFKTDYIKRWNEIDKPIRKNDKDKKAKDYKRLTTKRQLITDAIAAQGWLFRKQPDSMKDLTGEIDISDYYAARGSKNNKD